jgi:hypothetical protein
MKKVILSCTAVALLTFGLVSCGQNKETTTETTTTETTTTETAKPAETAVASDAPTFSNEEVNKGLAEYKSMINDYVAAIESKDQAKITDLTTKAQAVSASMSSWAAKLKPEETQKFSEYMTKLSQEWSAAAMKAAGH